MVLVWVASGCGGPARYSTEAPAPTGFNVVLVTLDGVRWQDFFAGADPLLSPNPAPLFPQFLERLAARQGMAYGDRRHGSAMTVSTAANASLPGYTSMFAEADQGCLTNGCARVAVPTMFDRIHDELGVPASDNAVFASWSKLRLAVSSRDDVAHVRAGDFDRALEADHPQAALLDEGFETDRGTVLEAAALLAKARPRVLYLSLLDSDRYGHQGDYAKYTQVLRAYDRLLATLMDRLAASAVEGRKTAWVVTTDHGRGLWDQWADHGPHVPASANVWAAVALPAEAADWKLIDARSRVFTHHDVRYTVETLLGLPTKSAEGSQTGFVAHRGARGR